MQHIFFWCKLLIALWSSEPWAVSMICIYFRYDGFRFPFIFANYYVNFAMAFASLKPLHRDTTIRLSKKNETLRSWIGDFIVNNVKNAIQAIVEEKKRHEIPSTVIVAIFRNKHSGWKSEMRKTKRWYRLHCSRTGFFVSPVNGQHFSIDCATIINFVSTKSTHSYCLPLNYLV